MKHVLLFFMAVACLLAQQEAVTPNIGLQVPSYGQTNYQVPLQYDLNLLDQYLSGVKPIPALTVIGTLNAPGFVPSSGSIITGLGYTPAADPGANGLVYRTAIGASTAIPFPLAAKGDLFSFSSVPARLPVGTDGQVPIADSTQTLGIRWGSVATPTAPWGVNPADYNFTPISPGGVLTGGTPATITLSFAPKGVNGTNANPYYMYISAGVGTAEAVQITGGTCASGGTSSCTLQFTPANAHSSAWTISSASSGLQEALNVAGNVLVPFNANLTVRAPVTPVAGAAVTGVNEGSCTITYTGASTALFNVINDRFTFSGCTAVQSGTPTSGNVAIRTYGPGASSPGTSRWGYFGHLQIVGFYNGILAEGNEELLDADHVQVENSISDGVVLNGVQGYWNSITSENGGGNGFTLGSSTGFGGSILFSTNWQSFNNAGVGILSHTNLYLSGGNTYLNNDKLGELYVDFASADAGYIADANIQFAGQTISWGTNTSAVGITVTSASGPFTIKNCHLFNQQGIGILINAPLAKVIANTIVGSGQGGVSGNLYSIAGASSTRSIISNNSADTLVLFNGNGLVITGNTVSTNSTLTAADLSGGTDVLVDQNYFENIGSGPAFGINTGVTYNHGNNIVKGTFTNLGTVSSHSSTL